MSQTIKPDLTYKEIKNGLINYFTKVENYKLHKSKISDNTVYFYSSDNDIQIIKLSNQNNDLNSDSELNNLENKVSNSQHHKIKMMNLIIQSVVKPIVSEEDALIKVITDEQNLKLKLEPFFGKINGLEFEQAKKSFINKKIKNNKEDNQSSIEQEDYDDDDFLSSFKKQEKELLEFSSKLKMNQMITTWLILLTFVVAPIVFMMIGARLQLDIYQSTFGLSGLQTLFTGGTNYNLTILGGQWWRIITYGFAASSSSFFMGLLLIILVGFALLNLSKISEKILGPGKLIISFIPAYLLTGFFTTVMLPGMIIGSNLPILGIMIGILGMSTALETNIESTFARRKLIWPFILAIVIALFGGSGMSSFIVVGTGLVTGAMITMIVKNGFKKWNWRFSIPVISVLALIIIPTIMIVIPRYLPAINTTTLWTLRLYLETGVLKNANSANNIMNKIGWDVTFKSVGNGFTYIINII